VPEKWVPGLLKLSIEAVTAIALADLKMMDRAIYGERN